MKLARPYLVLLNPIYWVIVFFRNLFYDLGIFKSEFLNIPIIAIGNLSTGGTGKTPHTEYLIECLKEHKKLAVLSRGYRRESVGYQEATKQPDALQIGDEPAQIKSKYPEITVAVDVDRVNGVKTLLAKNNPPEVILLDDAFQHRKLQAGFYVLLSPYQHLFVDDWVLPAGNLREQRKGYERAQCIVVTKCPSDLSAQERQNIISRIKPKSHQEVFFSTIAYANPLPLTSAFDFQKGFVLVTGIADASPLTRHLQDSKKEFQHLNFADHYRFSEADTMEIIAKAREKGLCQVLTTEKDYQRIDVSKLIQEGIQIAYLPISMRFIGDEQDFSKQILDYVTSYD